MEEVYLEYTVAAIALAWTLWLVWLVWSVTSSCHKDRRADGDIFRELQCDCEPTKWDAAQIRQYPLHAPCCATVWGPKAADLLDRSRDYYRVARKCPWC